MYFTRHDLVRTMASFAIVAALNIALNSLSLFGFHDASAAFSRDFVSRIMAVGYPPSVPASTVVLMDDRSDIAGDTYPLKLGTHAQVLEAMLELRPKAVYVDFAFFDARPDDTLARFRLMAHRFKERHVPLYVAGYVPTLRPERGPIRPELADLVASGEIRLVSFALGPTVWGVPTYQFFDKEQNMPTAVGRMVEDLLPDRRTVLAGQNTIEIAWALPPSPFNCRRAGGCNPSDYGYVGRLVAGLKINGIVPFSSSIKDPAIVQYVPNIAAHELFDGDAEQIASIIKDKVIFYGPNFDVARDAIPNPVFTYADERGTLPGRQLPGAFVHAMAFENVKDLGMNVKHPRLDDQTQWIIETALVVPFVLAYLVAAKFSAARIRQIEAYPWVKDFFIGSCVRSALLFGAWSLRGLIPGGLVAGVAVFQYRILNQAPSNWCGLFMLVTLSSILSLDQWLADRLPKRRAAAPTKETEESNALA